MKNTPRIFIDGELRSGMTIPTTRDVAHYLRRVMRRGDLLAFGGGYEFYARLSDDDKNIIIGDKTPHTDPSGDVVLYFAPIKKTDDLVNMATQLGVAELRPVITERTVAHHINWARMQKIIIEAAEQSNRNSVPKLFAPVRFSDLDLSQMAFADERAAYGAVCDNTVTDIKNIMVGPEGGFSDAEFAALDNAGACGIGLGKTILRAELAAAIAINRITK